MWKEINVNSSKVFGSVYFVAQQRMLKKELQQCEKPHAKSAEIIKCAYFSSTILILLI